MNTGLQDAGNLAWEKLHGLGPDAERAILSRGPRQDRRCGRGRPRVPADKLALGRSARRRRSGRRENSGLLLS
jgi:hypothetical protein